MLGPRARCGFMALVGLAAACKPVLTEADAGPRPLCVNGQSADRLYPRAEPAFALLATVPDLTFDGLDEQGQPARIALHDFYEPCAARSRLLVIRTSAAWCGTCRWDVAHTSELAGADLGERLVWLELVVAGEDGSPPTRPALERWRARSDRPGRVAADPSFSFGPLDTLRESLPFTVLVDTRTMTIRAASGSSSPEAFASSLGTELADLDARPRPSAPTPERFDGLFGRKEWELLHQMGPPGAPPADPTNAWADDPAAAALGRQLFFDPSLSPSGTISCASCHDPAKHFADGRPTSQGAGVGSRNAPSLLLAAHRRWQFWDGRADSLWSQALGPFENPVEFGSSRLFVAHAVFDRHRAAFEAVFGAMPALGDLARFPAAGMPGDAAWSAMTAADQQSVTRVFVNVGKAIAAYERTLRARPNRLDAYLAGDLTALSATEKKGLQTFFVAGCAQCHWGPNLTDDAFHVVRFPTGQPDGQADRGRVDGLAAWLDSDFGASGAFSDDPDAGAERAAPGPSMLGAFKTPPLRGVADTAPYGHGGTLATLHDVAALYGTAGLQPDDARALGQTEPWVTRFTAGHVDALVPFLELLSADVAP
ncbi:MAG: hypothetical protein IPJ65_26190 [Archangiaceae bacterium]|nr:hypothetical protein [Archangiaceae bacterium]